MTQEFNLNVRIVVKGDDADQATEEDVTKFIFYSTVGGSIDNENPFIDYDLDCELDWIEID